MWFPNKSDTNRPVQTQKRARSVKFRIVVEEELYYPSSENKGADQLRGLRLCFRIYKLLDFSCGCSYYLLNSGKKKKKKYTEQFPNSFLINISVYGAA